MAQGSGPPVLGGVGDAALLQMYLPATTLPTALPPMTAAGPTPPTQTPAFNWMHMAGGSLSMIGTLPPLPNVLSMPTEGVSTPEEPMLTAGAAVQAAGGGGHSTTAEMAADDVQVFFSAD